MTIHTDPYSSRIEDTPRFIERRDPVVHGNRDKVRQGPLSADKLNFYETNGFLFFEQLFSPEEVRHFRDELIRLHDDDAVRRQPEIVLEPNSRELRSIFAVHQSNAIFRKLSRDKRLVTIASQLLGSPVYVHQSRINYKPGFHGKEFYWHSDFETWHMEDGMPRMRAVSCVIALSENNEFNGPLLLIPGSHKMYVTCVGATPQDHYRESLRKQEYGVPDPQSLQRLVEQGGIAAPKGAGGSVVFFECNVMHGSNSNITPWPRHNIFFVYNSIENALVKPFCGLEPRPEFIASRDFAPIESED